MSDIEQWLHDNGLGRYAETFVENDIDLDLLPHLTDEDIDALGLPVGSRRRLKLALERLSTGSAGAPVDAPDEVESARGDAERRQLTVMFADLVGSTELSGQMDPEDLREITRAYQEEATRCIKGLGGYVARYMGDGVLAYFGYPRARENDAERAVRAGLALVEGVNGLDTTPPLAVRVGIATGAVVVGDVIGEGISLERSVVGETPNLAARLQGLAAPNQVVLAEATQQLTRGLFQLRELGAVELKGFPDPVNVFAVAGEERHDEAASHAEHPNRSSFVGRRSELALMLDRWSQAIGGEGHLLWIVGEPGVGKSRIVRELQHQIEGTPHSRVLYFGSPFHQQSVLYPALDQLRRGFRIDQDDDDRSKIGKLESAMVALDLPAEAHVPLLAQLLGISNLEPYQTLYLGRNELAFRTRAEFLTLLEAGARRLPTLMILEDVHWFDPATHELVGAFVERIRDLPVLAIAQSRPEYRAPWAAEPHVTTLTLNRLTRRESEELAAQAFADRELSPAVREEIVARSDGVPLFVEEIAQSVAESLDAAAKAAMASITVPMSLHDSLMERLDRVGSAKVVAQIGAVIGRRFDYDLLSAVADVEDAALSSGLERLVEAGLLYRRGAPANATYEFKHGLVRDTAYASLLRARRSAYHERIARALLERSPDLATTEPELVANHFIEAGLVAEALPYLRAAGRIACERSSGDVAVRTLERARELVETLPAGDARAKEELEVQLLLGTAYIMRKGWGSSEARSAFQRARELGAVLGEESRTFDATWGVCENILHSGELDRACEMADELLQIAQNQDDPGVRLQAHHAIWTCRFAREELSSVYEHCREGMALYVPEEHRRHIARYGGHDVGMCSRMFGSLAAMLLGFPDEARRLAREGLEVARSSGHTFSYHASLSFGASTFLLARDYEQLAERVEMLRVAAEREGAPPVFASMAKVFSGWLEAQQTRAKVAVETVARGVEEYRVGNPDPRYAFQLAILAEACLMAGEWERGLEVVAEAEDVIDKSKEHRWESEVLRIKGALLAETGREAEAAATLERALEVARRQGARWFELRAATRLAHVLLGKDERQSARDLLAPLLGWYTEGFSTPDLTEARSLLGE